MKQEDEDIKELPAKSYSLQQLKQVLTEGGNFSGHPLVEIRLSRLQHLLESSRNNEEKVYTHLLYLYGCK